MKQGRIHPDRLEGSSVFRPTAAPTDGFVPLRDGPQRSGLRDVVEALSGVAPRIERFAVSMAEDQAKEDTKAAIIAAQQLSEAADWKEAVEKGLVEPGASPVFRRVWAETRGKIDATAATAEWEREMLAPDSPLLNAEDGAAVSKWLGEKRQAFLNGRDQSFALGATQVLQQAEARLTSQHARMWSDRRFNEAKEDLGRLMTDTIREGFAAGRSDEQIMRSVVERAVPHQFAGLPRADVNQVVATAIIAHAKRVGETDAVQAHRILDLAYANRPDLSKPGATLPGVGRVPAIGANIEDARRSIDSAAWTREQRDRSRRAEEREQQKREFYDRVAPLLASGRPLSTQDMVALFRLDAGDARATAAFQQGQTDRSRMEAIRSAEDEIVDRQSRGLPTDMNWIVQRFGGMQGSGDRVQAASRILQSMERADVSAAETQYLPYIYATMLNAPSALEAIGQIGNEGLSVNGRTVRLSDGAIRKLSGEAMQLDKSRDGVTEGIWRRVSPSLRAPTTLPEEFDQRYSTQAYFAYQRAVFAWEEEFKSTNNARPTPEQKRVAAMEIADEITNWARQYQSEGRPSVQFHADMFVRGRYTKPVQVTTQPTQEAAPAAPPAAEFPMDMVQKRMSAFSGTEQIVQYVPRMTPALAARGETNIIPDRQRITALVEAVTNYPDMAKEAIEQFDADYGPNAAYHYFTRWRNQQQTRR